MNNNYIYIYIYRYFLLAIPDRPFPIDTWSTIYFKKSLRRNSSTSASAAARRLALTLSVTAGFGSSSCKFRPAINFASSCSGSG